MNGKAALAVFGALALVAANAWAGAGRQALSELTQAHWSTAFRDLKTVGLELLVVLVIAAIAQASDAAASLMLVVVLGLWILFAIHTWGSGKATSTTSTVGQKGGSGGAVLV